MDCFLYHRDLLESQNQQHIKNNILKFLYLGFSHELLILFIVFMLKHVDHWTIFRYKSLHKKMKFSIKDFFSKCDQIRSFLKKSLMENFIFCAVIIVLLCSSTQNSVKSPNAGKCGPGNLQIRALFTQCRPPKVLEEYAKLHVICQ